MAFKGHSCSERSQSLATTDTFSYCFPARKVAASEVTSYENFPINYVPFVVGGHLERRIARHEDGCGKLASLFSVFPRSREDRVRSEISPIQSR